MPAADWGSYGGLSLPPPRTGSDMIPSSSIVPSIAPRKALRDDLEAFHIASTPVANRLQANTVPDSAVAPHFSRSTNDFIQPSSPLMSRKTAPASQSHLTVSGVDMAPSSPVLPRLFETPIKQRPSNTTIFTDDVFQSTPPEPRRATNLFATPVKKAATSVPTTTDIVAIDEPCKPALSIYQQLGWDDYDVDDLA